MIDPKLAAELAQSRATIIELLPPLWRGLYNGCLVEGFSEQQSLALVQTYILSQNPYGIRGVQ